MHKEGEVLEGLQVRRQSLKFCVTRHSCPCNTNILFPSLCRTMMINCMGAENKRVCLLAFASQHIFLCIHAIYTYTYVCSTQTLNTTQHLLHAAMHGGQHVPLTPNEFNQTLAKVTAIPVPGPDKETHEARGILTKLQTATHVPIPQNALAQGALLQQVHPTAHRCLLNA